MTRNRWRFFAIGIAILVSLSTLFLWKEHLSFSKSINDQKFTNFFLILGVIAAISTIFFLARQLNEQRLLRLASVLPELYPKNSRFTLIESQHEMAGKK